MGASPLHVVVFSTLFPNGAQPHAGLFIRERMFRVARHLPLSVVAPMPWFPLQSLIRLWRPGFRPPVPRRETQAGIQIIHCRFPSFPGLFKSLDGILLALGSLPTLWRLKRAGRLDVLDAHFGYPDGYAATLLGRWLRVPVTITMRGTEVRHAADPALAPRLRRALEGADRVFTVSASLRELALKLGVAPDKVRVIGNGVDTARFAPVPKAEARAALGLPADAPVLISVGGLAERKGFHRVIDLLPDLRRRFPGLMYLIAGGASAEGDWRARLERQVGSLGLTDTVRFLGVVEPDELKGPLSAADVFVLATRNEGWANVFLEAMACGVPVVTTDVGGNREVVCRPELGAVVPFGEPEALREAVMEALARSWDREALVAYARDNEWSRRVAELVEEFGAFGAAGDVARRQVQAEGQVHG
ncbi:glycosyltransferase [Azoarcus sp. KH32C]|uniref:glycosyltransferase n=1 Tax=Azoarcus sp. KH32C TaxID=748247 RepID=UPI000238689B|nr:glycosyltransferase [Azoarcus sp. KH32C]BAL25899.1 glycosyltransferase family protein [Azoarcus sp. KH32C]